MTGAHALAAALALAALLAWDFGRRWLAQRKALVATSDALLSLSARCRALEERPELDVRRVAALEERLGKLELQAAYGGGR